MSQSRNSAPRSTTARVALKSATLLAKGWGTLTAHRYAYTDQDGITSTHQREVYDHGHAAAVILFDPDAGTVVLVRQFRLCPHLNGEDGFLLEVPAGLLDGEDPTTAIRREALEETGIDPQNLEPAGHIYPSPGSLNEKLYLFTAAYAGPVARKRGGLEHEGEDIEIIEMPLGDALELIGSGGITDAKTIILLQQLALRRL